MGFAKNETTTTILDVAKYILEKQGAMSPMKLQKLCYYCQAWSLVWDDAPLFEEDFRAWGSGPVCEDLYKKVGHLPIVRLEDLKGGKQQ